MKKLKNYITTFSKVHFVPTEPLPEDIRIDDIAHALSLRCMGNGHYKSFYPVALHALNCALEAKARACSERLQLACLLYHASETYLTDMPQALIGCFPQYSALEEKMRNLIYDKFLNAPLTAEELASTAEIDTAVLYYEDLEFLGEKLFDISPNRKSSMDFAVSNCETVERQFLNTYRVLLQESGADRPLVSVGVDGCAGKWVAVSISENGFEVNLYRNIKDVCEKYGEADSVIVDMPIGLPENLSEMRPDCELRKRLKGKASSVFNTPCRQAVYAANYTQAIEENKKVLHGSISPLSNAIIPKIREIDLFLQENPEWKNRLLESHPEFCFSLLNRNSPILENKKTLTGIKKRMDLLSRYYPESYSVVKSFQKIAPSVLSTKLDDVIDALALAVVGLLGLKNGFYTVPGNSMADSTGIKMQILGANLVASDKVFTKI